MNVVTSVNFKKDMFKFLEEVASSNKVIEITMNNKQGLHDDVILVSKREWTSMQEELYLQRTGTLNYISSLMENSTKDDFEEI
ncbi:type II toxin-antitoxin system Phd/YefM family antitoxin [Listeria sp. FSL L7-0091]|uniref:type II toxin-antitoxin system Phd/YefM family antitoxin n=1 Tax=Listeria farberi TaxID=2713500 RepID=UPI00162885A4|nr:type II toxin-antitoxin system Phd/YefM family antitoxin [Listeria farberi]MBC2261886.1 type II toxin-antitoxin system Phd/YefM family antitoxin [Listeria farberi]